MPSPKTRLLVFLILTVAFQLNAHAQLSRYIGDTPAKEAVAQKRLRKEACVVVNKTIVAYKTTYSYQIVSYAIRSFEGQSFKLALYERPFDDHLFHIEMPGDSIVIRQFMGLVRVHHLTENLLEIVYSPRGGSDEGFDNVIILGVNQNKICIAMEVQSVDESDVADEYYLYNLHLKLLGSSIDNYKLAVNVRELSKVMDNTSKSYNRINKYSVKFDKVQKIFFNKKEKLDASIEDPSDDEKLKTYSITGVYPVILLGKHKYYFINNRWFTSWTSGRDGKQYLFSYTERP